MLRRSRQSIARQVLLKGIEDLEGTIHANDAKCSAALITHGLLFAGLVTVTANAADVYPGPHGVLPILVIALASMTLLAFAVSIVSLLLAVMPYQPEALATVIKERHHPPGLFFPTGIPRRRPIPGGVDDPVRRQLRAAEALDESAVTLELVAESVKLAGVRDHEAEHARIGYRALIAEVVLAVAYLGVIAAIALKAA